MKTKSKLLFPILALIVVGLLVAGIAFAWTNPSGNPPTGGGALYYSDGNVGIGTATPTTAKLVVDGTISASAPTADSHVATKAYVDAAGSAGDFYVTTGTYQGATASTACDSGYHMCYAGEWIGKKVNTTNNCNHCWGNGTWFDTHSNTGDGLSADCLNWSSSEASLYGATIASSGYDDYAAVGWRTKRLICSTSSSVICCKN